MSDEDTAVLLSTDNISVEPEETAEPKQETYQNTAQTIILSPTQSMLSSIATFMSGLIFGYELGLAANLIKPMSSVHNLSCGEHFYIVTWWLFGVLLAAVLGGYIIDTLGRRGSITMSMVMLLMNSIISILLSKNGANALPHLYLKSRFILGFAGPLSAIAQNVYMSEISEPENRGYRISVHQFGFAFGSLISFLPVFYMDPYSEWRLALTQMIGFQSGLVIYVTMFCLPPSPNDVEQTKPQKTKNKKRNYRIEVLLETIGMGLFLVEVQQLSGRYTVLYYAPRLFSFVGICANDASKLTVTLYSIIKFLASGLCLLVVDRLGRRVSLIMSATIMMTCLSLLALLATMDDPDISPFFFYPDSCDHLPQSDPSFESWRPDDPDEPYALPKSKSPPPYPMLPTPLSLVSSQSDVCPDQVVSNLSPALQVVGIVTVIVYQVADVLGYGTVTWIVLSEIFPTSVRGRCACVITMISWMDIGAPSMFMQIGSTIGSTFLTYSFICMGSIIVTYCFIPETRNKTLEQIAQDLRELSLIPRLYDNLSSLPLIGNSQWLKRRMQNSPPRGSTVI